MKNFKRIIGLVLCIILSTACLFTFTACKWKDDYKINKELDTSKPVTLRISSGNETWPALDSIIAEFEEIYPNCTVVYEYVENYSSNLTSRLGADAESKIDIFKSSNIQVGKNDNYKEYAVNLLSEESQKYLDLSRANQGIVDNFKYIGEDNALYCVPYAAEMRGMYVNVTLLKSLNLEVPTNRAELLSCCDTLLKAGYVPFQASVGTFGQQLLYPYICSLIANSANPEVAYSDVENIRDGVISEYFRDAYSLLYTIVEKGYYDYKYSEEVLKYTFDGDEGCSLDFLNIMKDEDTAADDDYKKMDDLGKVAFMTNTQSLQLTLDKVKEDYHSAIEYVFITAPVGEEGGYAYLSPSDGFVVNKNSDNVDWALEFLDFVFSPNVNKVFATEMAKIPNSYNAFDVLEELDVPSNRACTVGDVTFSYNLYSVVTPLLCGTDSALKNTGLEITPLTVCIGKMNAKKYMICDDKGTEDTTDDTYSIKYSLDDYMERLEEKFHEVKVQRSITAE